MLVGISQRNRSHDEARPARNDLQRLHLPAWIRVSPHPQVIALGECRKSLHGSPARVGPSALVPGHEGRLRVDVCVVGEASARPADLESGPYGRPVLAPASLVEYVLRDVRLQRVVRRIHDAVRDDHVPHSLADGHGHAAPGAVQRHEAGAVRLSLRRSDQERQPPHGDVPKLDVTAVLKQFGSAVTKGKNIERLVVHAHTPVDLISTWSSPSPSGSGTIAPVLCDT